MTITGDATDENGMLKLERLLPLKEHEKVRVTVQPGQSLAQIMQVQLVGAARPNRSSRSSRRPRSRNCCHDSNDALGIALMRLHELTNLASHDVDFDRVPSITRYRPG
jgi:predicted nucleic acid-binding protein